MSEIDTVHRATATEVPAGTVVRRTGDGLAVTVPDGVPERDRARVLQRAAFLHTVAAISEGMCPYHGGLDPDGWCPRCERKWSVRRGPDGDALEWARDSRR